MVCRFLCISYVTSEVKMTSAKPHPPNERMYVYVDGFNLYWGMHDLAKRRLLWLDLVKLAESLRPRSNVAMVKYFSAPVLDEPAAQSRQAHYVAALESLYPHRLTVHMGRYQKSEVRCNHCGGKWNRYEEKETDVSIAVSLVADAAQQRFQSALIISADSDLSPAVRAVKDILPSAFVTAAFPPKRHSAELKKLMPAAFHIGNDKLSKAQLPECFTASGKTYMRPDYWR